MAKGTVVFNEFHGGWATSDKQGPEASFAYSKHIDFRKDPMGMSVLPETVKESSTTISSLVCGMIQMPSGKIYATTEQQETYSRTTAGTWAAVDTIASPASCISGMHYNLQQDTIFIPGLNNIHTITDADGRFAGTTPAFNEGAITANVDQSATDSTNIYTTTTSVNEGATHKLSVTPTVEPMYSIKIWVTTKGTGDVTVTMHDAANNKLAEVTKTAASLTNAALNEYVFTAPVRNTVKPNASTYHFHVTHNGAGTATTIGTATSSDLSDARFETYANRLVAPNNKMHPVINFLQYMLIGNERYVAVWEIITNSPTNTELLRHRVVLEPDYEVTSFALWTEYVAIAAEKRSTSSTNEFQQGRIYFWDGVSVNWNFAIDVPEGAPYSLRVHRNILYYVAGGALWAWAGGQPIKVFQLPNTDFEFTDSDTYMVNYPSMIAVRNGILQIGFPSETNSTNIEHAVYSYGARNKDYDETFGLSYTMSTGSTTNGTLRLGCLQSFGDKMFVAWRDGSSYGVDIIDTNSDPFSTATWESLIMDFGRPDKPKGVVKMRITFETLPTGATVTPKYKINREATWNNDDDAIQATAGASEVLLPINKSFKEIQLAYDLTATTTTPKIISISLVVDDKREEQD